MTAVPLSLAVIGLSVTWHSIASKLQEMRSRALSFRCYGKLTLPSKIGEVVSTFNFLYLYFELLTRSIFRRWQFGQLFTSYKSRRTDKRLNSYFSLSFEIRILDDIRYRRHKYGSFCVTYKCDPSRRTFTHKNNFLWTPRTDPGLWAAQQNVKK